MNMLNKVMIEGEMVKLTEQKKAEYKRHCILCIVNYREGKNGTEENIFDIECFGTIADKIADNFCDGKIVRVMGKMKPIYWKDQDGKKNSRMQIIAEHLEFI